MQLWWFKKNLRNFFQGYRENIIQISSWEWRSKTCDQFSQQWKEEQRSVQGAQEGAQEVSTDIAEDAALTPALMGCRVSSDFCR